MRLSQADTIAGSSKIDMQFMTNQKAIYNLQNESYIPKYVYSSHSIYYDNTT